MSKRLNFTNILNTKNEGLRKRILNTYELNKQDKRNILNNINNPQNQTEDDVVYIKFNPNDDLIEMFVIFPSVVKAFVDEELRILSMYMIENLGYETIETIGISFHLNDILCVENKKLTIKEYLDLMFENTSLKWEDLNFITKEEFYNTNI